MAGDFESGTTVDQPRPKWEGKACAQLLGPNPEQIWPFLEDFFGLSKWFPTLTASVPVEGVSGQPGCIRLCSGFRAPVDEGYYFQVDKERTVNRTKKKLLSIDPTRPGPDVLQLHDRGWQRRVQLIRSQGQGGPQRGGMLLWMGQRDRAGEGVEAGGSWWVHRLGSASHGQENGRSPNIDKLTHGREVNFGPLIDIETVVHPMPKLNLGWSVIRHLISSAFSLTLIDDVQVAISYSVKEMAPAVSDPSERRRCPWTL